MKSNVGSWLFALGVLAAAGALAARAIAPVQTARTADEVRWREMLGTRPAGEWVAALGGYRRLIADLLWLELHARWEERDLAATRALVEGVSAMDPESEYFWLNGARIIGYDLPVWRIEAAGGWDQMPREAQRQIVEEQAHAAIAHVNSALAFHPCNAELWLERGHFENRRLRDYAAAAESYRRAAEIRDAPAYAARLQTEMLRRIGRERGGWDK